MISSFGVGNGVGVGVIVGVGVGGSVGDGRGISVGDGVGGVTVAVGSGVGEGGKKTRATLNPAVLYVSLGFTLRR